MPSLGFTQDNRLISVTTPLGKDVLLLGSFTGWESVSGLFQYTLEMVAENTETINYDELLGQSVTVEIALHDGGSRYINGIVSKLVRRARGLTFTEYTAELVPRLWLTTRSVNSRIFQHINVPNILKKILSEYSIDAAFEIQGTFEPRDFCVQYRETDFAFLSRMMEEEGIYYYFKHSAGGHKMVLANTPQSHSDMPHKSTLIYEEVGGGWRSDERIQRWAKAQEIRPGKVTLWDHCFELPHRHLEAEKTVLDAVQVGRTQQKLKVAGNDKLEIYDYPGAYAQRFDGIDKSGGEQASNLQKIFEDNKRTANIRMEQETVRALVLEGDSNYANLVAGHKFTLTRHFQDDGVYVVTYVQTNCSQGGNYKSSRKSAEEEFSLTNNFQAIPFAVPFRPVRVTPKPVIYGTQTAVVVGPPGEEIFTDKYGRVKIQFHWDREGKANADSSCWVRVTSFWAGKTWGAIHIPRIGQEVVVAFEEGDPDRPLIIGSVYNASEMPPYTLPDNKTQSGIKSRSSKDAGSDQLNEIRFEDKKGSEYIFIHGEKDLEVRIKKDRKEFIGQDRHLIVKRDKFENVERDKNSFVKKDYKAKVEGDQHAEVVGKVAHKIGGSLSLEVAGNVGCQFKSNCSVEVSSNLYLKGMQTVVEGVSGLTIKVGGSHVTCNAAGVIITGSTVLINSGGAALSGSLSSLVPPSAPTAAQEALEPGTTGREAPATAAAGIQRSITGGGGAGGSGGRTRQAQQSKTHFAQDPENQQKKSWIEIVLEDEAGQPVPGEYYEIVLPDGQVVASGTLDEKGFARVDHIDPGTCKITFPNLDKDAWEPK